MSGSSAPRRIETDSMNGQLIGSVAPTAVVSAAVTATVKAVAEVALHQFRFFSYAYLSHWDKSINNDMLLSSAEKKKPNYQSIQLEGAHNEHAMITTTRYISGALYKTP